MGKRKVGKRGETWDIKTKPELLHPVLESKHDEMAKSIKRAYFTIDRIYERVAEILDNYGVHTQARLAYRSYAERLYKFYNIYSGNTLKKMFDVTTTTFFLYGCDEDILKQIGLLFGVKTEVDPIVKAKFVPPPPPPPPPIEIWYEITIDNTANPNDLSDYQVLLEITNDKQFFEDCENNKVFLEFYDEDKSTLLSHFVDLWDTINYNAKIWIKIPLIPASSIKKCYLKINKQRTQDLSNPKAVFLLYDDFDDGILDPNWTQVGHGYGASEWVEANGVLDGKTMDWNALLYYKGFNENSICIDVDIMIVNADELQGIILRYEDSIDEGYSTELYDVSWWYTAFQTREIVQDGGNILAYYSMTFEKNVWYHIRTRTHQDRIIHELYKDETLLVGLDVSGLTEHPSGSVGFLMDCWTSQVHTRWDNLRVRRYIPPEPTVSYSKI